MPKRAYKHIYSPLGFFLILRTVGAFSCFIFVSLNSLFAQSLEHEWSFDIGNSTACKAWHIDADDDGNKIIAGVFFGTVDFDPGIGIFPLTSTGLDDWYVLKVDSLGEFVWAKQFDLQYIEDVAIDSMDNVVLTGVFLNTSDFDPGQNTYNLSAVGALDGFICKLNTDGDFVNAISFGGNLMEQSNSMVIDANNNIYLAGWFEGTADFDPSALTTNLTVEDQKDAFIAKYNQNLEFQWVKQIQGQGNEGIDACITSFDRFLYVTGGFLDNADLNPTSVIQNETVVGFEDQYVLKLDTTGLFVWGKTFGGGASAARSRNLACDSEGNLLNFGTFSLSIDFDPGPGVATATANSSGDCYVQKLSPNGNFLWVRAYGGISSDQSYTITLDSQDNIYLSGSFAGPTDFDPGAGNYILNSAGGGVTNAYINVLDVNGNFLHTYQFEASVDVVGKAHTMDAEDNIFFVGDFQGFVDADPSLDTVEHVTVTQTSGSMLCVKLANCNESIIDSAAACDSFTWVDGTTYFASNTSAQFIVQNTLACDTVYQLHLTITSNDTSISQAGGVLTSNQSNASYQWIDCGNSNVPVFGETATSFLPSSNGNYALVLNQNGCIDTTDCIIVDYLTVSEDPLKELRVFPNPTTDDLFVGGLLGGNNYFLELITLDGKKVSSKQLSSGTTRVIMPNESGVYLLRFIRQNKVEKILLVRKV